MIKVISERTRGSEPPFPVMVSVRSVDNAFNSLVEYELGYGGRVTVLEARRVVVVTRILGCVDTTTFEGSAEDMALLNEVSLNTELVRAETMRPGNPLHDVVVDNVMKVTKGVPLSVRLASPILMGQPLTKLSLVMCCKTEDDQTLARLVKLSIKDLCSLVSLVRLDGASLQDALALAEATPEYDIQGKICGLTTSV